MLISVIVIINGNILHVAQEKNLPFLLIPTDLDVATFLERIQKPDYPKFKIALAFDDSLAYLRLAEAQTSVDCTTVTGFVIRPDFFEQKNLLALKNEYQVPQDKPVILLLLGAVGLQSLYEFTQELAKLKNPAHLIICTGRQKEVKEKIDALSLPAHITKTTVSFTNRMSDIMAQADLFITKSGSVSVCEGLYMEVPMILDATTDLLAWEKANHQFIQQHGCGTILQQLNELAPLVDSILSDKTKLATYKKNLQALEKKHGGNQVKQLIWQMFNS
jgi:processive 1,2-diacylglycerol beta-glucosyltransferase